MRWYWILTVLIFFGIDSTIGQTVSPNFRSKKIAVGDSIQIDSVSINPFQFQILNKSRKIIDSSYYKADFKNGMVYLNPEITATLDSVYLHYYRYPDFLTKTYFQYDPSLIIPANAAKKKFFALSNPKNNTSFTPFEGLNTNGSISRGVTVGNNQNAVLNSELDLQISGKISDNVSLRASLQDSNIPIQQGGYSQNLDEFDQIFIELYSDLWKMRAGDVILQNANSYFNRFTKNVQGISISGTIPGNESESQVFGAGALVRGVFTRSRFTAQEGNQGPYKLTGPNGELFVLIVSGSERVYVNGLLLERGENKDYIIDYNAGEIRFNPTYPITSEMRISVEYQTTERNYSRIIAYGGGAYSHKKFNLEAFVYSENDAKNQSLQQNLNDAQKEILSDAGDDMSKMIAPSAVEDTFDENKVLYKKEIIDGNEVFVFTTDPEDTVFNVRFSLVGDNQGNYILNNVNTINQTYVYIPPINGIPQGNYAPVVQLTAPTKLQVAVVQGAYQAEKTNISFEVSGSKNDLNLFSDLDDGNNDGFAGRFQVQQRLFSKDSSWVLQAFANGDFVQEQFRSIERIYNIEFARDWNLGTPVGNQTLWTSGFELAHPQKGTSKYLFQYLDFSESYVGNRHSFLTDLSFKKWKILSSSSVLNSNTDFLDSRFFRSYNQAVYGLKKYWIGARLDTEENKELLKIDSTYTNNTQRFVSYETFTGVGDSTKIYTEIGYKFRTNDSVQNNLLEETTRSHTYYLKSNLINTKKTKLSIFANYRRLNFTNDTIENEQSLNSRIVYNQRFSKNKINWNTVFETNSGTLPRQEFTYVEVDPGRGTHTWNDYNDNGVQELNEFEIAPFADQATFLRVLLPNQVFIKTNQTKLSQLLTLNPANWSNSKKKYQKFLSHFYNQTSYIIDRKNLRENDSFTLNPFKKSDDELALNLSFRNTLFFNRGKQRYTTSYTYLDADNTNLLVTGLQENSTENHQFQFVHKVKKFWLFDVKNEFLKIESKSENFDNRNYLLDGYSFLPKISYLFSLQTQLSVFYENKHQDNTIGEEELLQQNLGISFMYANKQKISLTGTFTYIDNDYEGNPFSPVGYQLLNGLQPGTNYTWSLLAQKKLTNYLDLNISYSGRKSEDSNSIHTGTVQLRAYF